MQTTNTHDTEPDIKARNMAGLIRLGLVIGVSLLFASLGPPALVPSALSAFLSVGAMAAALLAALSRESTAAAHLTRWDEAALLLALSIGAGWFADPDAVAAAVEAL